MKGWSRSPITKMILFVLTVIMIVVFCGGAALLAALDIGHSWEDVLRSGRVSYETSNRFEYAVQDSIDQIITQQARIYRLETEGKLDEKKSIDMFAYAKEAGTAAYYNTDVVGLRYSLEQIEQWGEKMSEGATERQQLPGSEENPVVVCVKPDHTCVYLYGTDFLAMLKRGELRGDEQRDISEEADENEAYQGVSDLPESVSELSGWKSGGTKLFSENGSLAYIDFWVVEDTLPELFPPEGYDSLVDFVNQHNGLNGSFSAVSGMLRQTIEQICLDLELYRSGIDELHEGNTNLRYIYMDVSSGKIETNIPEIAGEDSVWGYISGLEHKKDTKYMVVRPTLKGFQSNMNVPADFYTRWLMGDGRKGDRVLVVDVDTTFPIHDRFYDDKKSFDLLYPMFYPACFATAFAFVFALVGVSWLTVVAGKKSGDEKLYLNVFDRCKTEISFLIVVGVCYCLMFFMRFFTGGVFYYEGDLFSGNVIGYAFLLCAFAGIVAGCGLGYLSFVKRIKGHLLWKNSLTYMFLSSVVMILRHLPEVWSYALGGAGVLFLHWLCLGTMRGWAPALLFLFVIDCLLVVYVARDTAAMTQIKNGLHEIVNGNLEYKIDRRGMYGWKWQVAGLINQIAEGLNRTVEENVKNERLKTDLITNVSHDIKTPLTSIITYVGLLRKETFDDPKIGEYIRVLEEKAYRLKTLTEDVVEAAKVSSGNISIDMVSADFTEMIAQVNGEFEERFRQADLALVAGFEKGPLYVRMDGRRMWRVLANLYSNALKYSAPGTRVYVDVRRREQKVIFSIKNVSSQQLNIPADELTERFIRGDISRSSEGSGLGLAIAKSLVEMMQGVLSIELDGDLFKVEVGLDVYEPESASAQNTDEYTSR